MADNYAPGLLLDVLVFWFVLRWLLTARAILLVGWLLIVMMVAGALDAVAQRDYIWAAFFVGSAGLAWTLLRRWRQPGVRPWSRWSHSPDLRAWRAADPVELAVLCERRVGMHVDAAVPAAVMSRRALRCVFALAGDGLWVLADESRFVRPHVGRVISCWARSGLVAHVEHARRWERLELSWPGQGALVRAVAASGAAADVFVGQLIADEFARAAE